MAIRRKPEPAFLPVVKEEVTFEHKEQDDSEEEYELISRYR
jgi:hypothetical protein